MTAQVPLIGPLAFDELVISLSNEPLGLGQIRVPARVDILPGLPLRKRRTAKNKHGTKNSNIQPVFSHGSNCTLWGRSPTCRPTFLSALVGPKQICKLWL